MKSIVISGDVFDVPEWVNFSATDSDGDCWGYENQPSIEKQSWCLCFPFGGHITFIGQPKVSDWRYSLMSH